jgi:hypothetical protein
VFFFAKLLLKAGVLVILTVQAAAENIPRDYLTNQANSDLKLLDHARYEEAWDEMSPIFHVLCNRDQWLRRQRSSALLMVYLHHVNFTI